MAFTVYPAIDIRGGKCVRLVKGDYDQETVYHEDPVEVYKMWVAQGAKYIHIVDLDGAKKGKPVNLDLVRAMVEAGKADGHQTPVQLGGGIRNMETLDAVLEAGVARAIIGTSAVENRDFVRAALAKYGDRVVIGLDCRDGYVATNGWLETATIKAIDLALELKSWGARLIIYTDIARDGMMSGPNIGEKLAFTQATGLDVIASGGVSNIDDIINVAQEKDKNIVGVIVGKALYMKAVTMDQIHREDLEC